jgi:hypothetical protein
MTTYLIAPPGTPPGEPGWHKPPDGLLLSWSLVSDGPPVAVQRDGVLVATGIQLGSTAGQQLARNMTLYGPCEVCGIARVTVQIQHPLDGTVLTLICPAGCNQEDTSSGHPGPDRERER